MLRQILSWGRTRCANWENRLYMSGILSTKRLSLPDFLVIGLGDDGQYVAHGSMAAVTAKKARGGILGALPLSEADALGLDILLEAADVKRGTGQSVIKELLEQGQLIRVGTGKKGDPYQYYREPETGKMLSADLGNQSWQKETGGANGQPDRSPYRGICARCGTPTNAGDFCVMCRAKALGFVEVTQ